MYCDAIGKLLAQVAPVQRVQALDNRKAFDFELHQALAEVGAWGVGVDESLGGSGGGPVLQVLTLEMLGQQATSMAVFGVIQYMATRLLRQFGTEEQKRQYLEPLCSGSTGRRAPTCLSSSPAPPSTDRAAFRCSWCLHRPAA